MTMALALKILSGYPKLVWCYCFKTGGEYSHVSSGESMDLQQVAVPYLVFHSKPVSDLWSGESTEGNDSVVVNAMM
jgi:hypothetical protein